MSDFTFIDIKRKVLYECMVCKRKKLITYDKKCVETGGLWDSKNNIGKKPFMRCPRCKALALKEVKDNE